MRESSQAREAFDCYLSLGPQRSLAKVGQALGKSTTILERWSKAHAWQERIAAHEKKLAEQAAQEEGDERRRARKQRLQVARGARSKGVEALTTLTAQDLARLPSALVRLLEYADNTERKDLGEPDQRVEVAGPTGGDITVRVIYDDGGSAGPGPEI
jgi:hypothetical protein